MRLERPAPAGADTEGRNEVEHPQAKRRGLPAIAKGLGGSAAYSRVPGEAQAKAPPRARGVNRAGLPGPRQRQRSLPHGPDPDRGWVAPGKGAIERDRLRRGANRHPSRQGSTSSTHKARRSNRTGSSQSQSKDGRLCAERECYSDTGGHRKGRLARKRAEAIGAGVG